MSINANLTEQWDVELLGDDFSGLNDIYREIADEIGIEKTMVIFNLFHGTQISFPNRLFSKEYTHLIAVISQMARWTDTASRQT